MSQFWGAKTSPAVTPYYSLEHPGKCSTSQHKRKTSWNTIKNEKSNSLWTCSGLTLHFLDQFCVFLFHHFCDPVLRFRINFKSCFMMLGRLADIPEVTRNDPGYFPETSFLKIFCENVHPKTCMKGHTLLCQKIIICGVCRCQTKLK